MSLIPTEQRAYLSSHPLAVWFAIGVSISGWVNIFFPDLAESSAQAVFSSVVFFCFSLTWVSGGSLAALGLLRGKPKAEGAGMTLLAASFLSYYLAIVSIRPLSAVSGLFVLTLAIGCGLRAKHLSGHGYVVLDVPTDQPGLK